jgi:hypothetical protein
VVIALLLGCGGGALGPTEVDDVLVIATVVSPPEVGLGDRVSVTVAVADPAALGVQVLLWTCVPFDGGCAEDAALLPSERLAIVDPALDEAVELLAPDELSFDGEGQTLEVPLWALACVPGDCGPLDAMAEVLERGELFDDQQRADLADPSRWAEEIGFDGANLAVRTVTASTRGVAERNQNPFYSATYLEGLDPVLVADRGEAVDLGFLVGDPNGDTVYAYAYTTIGAFAERRTKVEDGVVHPWFLAPAQAGTGELWIVFDDRDGGVAVWNQPVEVR